LGEVFASLPADDVIRHEEGWIFGIGRLDMALPWAATRANPGDARAASGHVNAGAGSPGDDSGLVTTPNSALG
jgi:hypothetical protein